jgi:hypothetical protein
MFIVHINYSRGGGMFQKPRLEDRVMLYSWFQFDDKKEIAIIALDVIHDHVPSLKTHARIREDGYITFFVSPNGTNECTFTTISQFQVNSPTKYQNQEPIPNKPTEPVKLDVTLFTRLQKHANKVAKDASYTPAKEIKFIVENQPQQLGGTASTSGLSFPSSTPLALTPVDESMLLNEKLVGSSWENRDDLKPKSRTTSDGRTGLKKNKSSEANDLKMSDGAAPKKHSHQGSQH